jgi:hypothetical protein
MYLHFGYGTWKKEHGRYLKFYNGAINLHYYYYQDKDFFLVTESKISNYLLFFFKKSFTKDVDERNIYT